MNNSSFNEHEKKKNEIIAYLKESSKVFEEFPDNQDNVQAIASLIKSLENNRFEIVFIGEFSSGKSTFLNALMGKRLLPSFNEETTATVTYLHDAKELDEYKPGIIRYYDDREEILSDLSLESIEKAVSTRGDIDKKDNTVAKRIKQVDLYIKDNPFLKEGVLLVDSPGLNGVAQGHKDITEKEIKKSHACIFVFNCDHPGAKTDFEFLGRVKKENHNIFFVLNKIDKVRISQGETVEKIINNLQRTIKEQFPEDKTMPKVYPISSIAALSVRDESVGFKDDSDKADTPEKKEEYLKISRLPAFEERLIKYLTKGEKAKAQFTEPINKVEAFLNSLRNRLETQNDFLVKQKSSEELIERKNKLDEEIKINENEKRINNQDIVKELNNIKNKLKDQCKSGFERIKNRINQTIVSKDVNDLWEYSKTKLDIIIQNDYSELLKDINQDFKDSVTELLNEKCSNLINELNKKFEGNNDDNSPLIEFQKINIDSVDLISSNLDSYRKEEKEIMNKLVNLENELEQKRNQAIDKAEKEEEAKLLYLKLERIKEDKKDIERTFIIPDAEVYYDEETKTQERDINRDGFFPWLWSWVAGQKVISVPVKKYDPSKQNAAQKKLNNILLSLGQDQKSIEDKINNLKLDNTKNSKVIEYEAKTLEDKIDKYSKDAKEKRDAFIKKVSEISNKNKERILDYINDYINKQNKEFNSIVNNFYEKQNKKYLEIISSVINKSIDSLLKTKKEELDNIIYSLEKQGNERETTINRNNTILKTIKDLLGKGIDLKEDLNRDLNDEIEMIEIEDI